LTVLVSDILAKQTVIYVIGMAGEPITNQPSFTLTSLPNLEPNDADDANSKPCDEGEQDKNVPVIVI